MMELELLEEPLTYAQASSHPGWAQAMEQEINAILKNNIWEIVDRPAKKSPITAKWIYKLKKDSSGNISKLKARIVTRGFQ